MIDAPWWLPPRRQWMREPDLHLLALPYAGGGATAYRGWTREAPPGVQVAALQLPGREARLAERALASWPDLLDALGSAVLALGDVPVALFGHSAGALVAFELARWLSRRGRSPAALLVSGCRAPHLPDRHAPLSRASDAMLIDELKRLGGTPAQALQHAELVELMLASLRVDCALYDGYVHRALAPLDIPLTVFGGTHDPIVERAELSAWAAHTRGAFRLHRVEGGHFYLHEPAFLHALRAALPVRMATRLAA